MSPPSSTPCRSTFASPARVRSTSMSPTRASATPTSTLPEASGVPSSTPSCPVTSSSASSPRSAPASPSSRWGTAWAWVAWSDLAVRVRCANPAMSSGARRRPAPCGPIAPMPTETRRPAAIRAASPCARTLRSTSRPNWILRPVRPSCAPVSPHTRRSSTTTSVPALAWPSSAWAASGTWACRSPRPWRGGLRFLSRPLQGSRRPPLRCRSLLRDQRRGDS